MQRVLFHRVILVLTLFLALRPLETEAQYYFGQNKIQYNRFEWQVMKTGHFDIYFYPQMDSLAEIGAHYAEESYTELQDRFNFNVLRRIPLVFYSSHFHFEETNTYPYLIPPGLGGFFEFIKGRVVVPGDGAVPRFRQTIRHELVHVFQQTLSERVCRDHRISQSAGLPLWFTEGLAEYWSEGWSSEAEMVIRDCVLNNTLVPIDDMPFILGTYLMYKEGQSILKFIAEEYGEESIPRLIRNLWKAETFSEVMRITLGKTARELGESWMYRLKKSMYPLMAESDFPRMVAGRVTNRGFNTMPAFYREDGTRWAVFAGNRDGYSGIYKKNLDADEKQKPELLIRGERTPELESFRLQKSKIDVNARGQLAFVAKSGGQDVLYIYNLRAKTEMRRHRWPELVSIFSPAWSPDGKSIAVSGLDQSGRSDLYVVDADSGSIRRLTCDFFDDTDPSWTADGHALVFSSDRLERGLGAVHLFMAGTDGKNVRALTSGIFKDRSPVCSRDGRTIAFVSDRDGVPNLWLLKADSAGAFTDMRQGTRFPGGVFSPCWTDSSGLLFSAFENMEFQIREQSASAWKAAASVPNPPQDASCETDSSAHAFPGIGDSHKTEKAKYSKKFSLDFAQSQVIQDPIFGTAGGGELVISDMLGNEQYYFLLFNNARTSSDFWDGFNLSATRLDLSRRFTTAVGLYRFAGLYYNNYDGYFHERRLGMYGAVSFPFNKFERAETSLNLRLSDKNRYDEGTSRRAFLASVFVSYTKDNSLWGPTGPLDGERVSLTLGQTNDVARNAVHFTTLMADVRRYVRLGPRMCWAVRAWGEFNLGKDPLPFFMGGSWDLRGYRFWSLWNPKLVFVSNELRFPFIDRFYMGFPFGGIGISSVRGALFVDAGNAWDREFGSLKGSMGFGVRFQLGGMLVLRYDTGRRTDFKRIESETFRQFFFGWDF